MRTLIVGIALCLVALSCERDAHIQVHDTDQNLVVEGTIENNRPPRVILTHSLNYFSTLNAALLENLFVHQARVMVSDGKDSVLLVEKTVDTLLGAKFYYYEPVDSSAFKGKVGQTYSLNIQVEGQSLKATTTIPASSFYLDSVWSVASQSAGKTDSSHGFLMARIIDPPELGNYARYFTKRNSEPYYPGLASVADDGITNGKVFDFQLSRGMPKNQDLDPEDDGLFDAGDTVVLKFCDIDSDTYHFWSTWEYAWLNKGNPFATPTAVEGNIPGALGYWGGYYVQYKQLIILK